jgi:hypothetical protein
MPEVKKTERPTEAEARPALRERILQLQASTTPLTDAEKAKVARRDPGCPHLGHQLHDQRVLARTELELPRGEGRRRRVDERSRGEPALT